MNSSSSSSSSSDDEYNSDFKIQWIFHFECFHYMKNIFIKEFTAYCIPTSDYFTCHVKCSPAIAIDADEIAKHVFGRQSRRLGFKWEDGDYDRQEFHDLLHKYVQKILAVKSLFLIALFLVTLIGTYVNPTPMPM